MNYYNFVNTILETAKSHKLVYEVGEGDIYEHLNSGDHKYPCVFLTVQNVDSNGTQMTVTGSLFYVDALLSDTSNKLQIQSTGMTTLQQIFMRLMDNYPDFDLRTGRYTPFDEKFSDLCAGVFSNFTISFMDDICIVNDDIFEGDVPTPPEPEHKYMTITVLDGEVGETIIEPKFYERSITPPNLQYRVNNGSWKDFVFGTTAAITAQPRDVIQWKGLNPNGVSVVMNNYLNYLNFSISGNPVSLSGSIMSLIDGMGECDTIPCDYCFTELFSNANIKTISDDFLPALTLKSHCYDKTFYNCKNLEKAPLLPAKELKLECYHGLFQMCKKLNYVKCLATIGTFFPSASATTNWLNGVAPTGTLEKPSEAFYLADSDSGIPHGWTVVELDEHYLSCENSVIRTNYLPTNNTRVVCKMRIDSCDMENEIGVATKGKSGNSFSCLYNPRNYSSTGHRFHIMCGEKENIFINDVAYKYEYGEEVTFEMSRDKFIFNSQHEYQTNGAPIENENFDVHIGDDEVPDENVKWIGRVYYLRIYEGDNLVRNFIPCDKNTLIDTISGHVCNHTGHVIYK